MTNEQYKVYAYLVRYTTDNGFPPLVREIADDLGFSSSSSVRTILKQLSTQGLITTKNKSARAIKLNGYVFKKKESNDK